MAIPDTTTFNLINVTDEFGLGGGDGLQDCFNDSSAGDFDGDYNPNSDGTNNNLLNFRNYGAGPTAFTGSSGQNDFAFLCSQTTATSYWHNGAGAYPTTGDIVYTNSAGTTPFTSYTYMLTSGSYGIWLEFGQSGSSGEVTNNGMCSPP